MTDAQHFPFKATFKSAGGYDAPWLTVDARTAIELKELVEDLNQQGTFAYLGNAAKSFHAAYNVAKILGPVEVEAPSGEPVNPAQTAYVAFDKAATAVAAAMTPAVAPAATAPNPWPATPAAEAAPAVEWPPAATAPVAAAPAAAPAAPAAAGWPAPPVAAAPAAPAAAGWPAIATPAPAAAAPAATGWGAVAAPVAPAGSAWGAAAGAAVTPPAATGVPQVANFGPARVKQDVAKSGPNAGQPYTRYDDPRPWSSIKDFIKTDNPNDPGLLAGTHRFEAYL